VDATDSYPMEGLPSRGDFGAGIAAREEAAVDQGSAAPFRNSVECYLKRYLFSGPSAL